MRSSRVTFLLPLLLLAASCRSKKESEQKIREQRQRAAAAVEGLDAIPAAVKVVVGLNVPRLAKSELLRRKVLELLTRNPDAQAMLEGLLTRCAIDPARDLTNVLIGLGDRPDGERRDSMLVAKGNFDEAKLVACVTASVVEKGGSLTTRVENGMTIHAVKGAPGERNLAFTFGAPDTVIVAQREEMLLAARDPAVPKIKSDAAMMALIGGADTRAAIWGAGQMTASVGERLTKVTSGAVKAPAEAIFGHVDLEGGVTIELNMQMQSADDARELAKFVARQLKTYTVIAQSYELGPVLSRMKSESHERVFRVSLAMEPKDVEKIEQLISEQISKRQAAGKTAPPSTQGAP